MVNLLEEGIEEASQNFLNLGCTDLVAIHFPEGSYGQSSSGEKFSQGSLALPKGYIKGAAGAGDAFCSGVLLGVHEDWPLKNAFDWNLCRYCLYVRPDLHGWFTFARGLPGTGR